MRRGPSISQTTLASLLLVFLLGCRTRPLGFSDISNARSDRPRPAALFPWSHPAYAGGNGSRVDQAVIITGVSVYFMGRKAKDDWISSHYPDSVVREVRKQIVRHHVIETASIQTPAGEIVQVYFDVTGVVIKPGIGAWYFLGIDGVEYAGMLDEQHLRNTDSQPWLQLVGTSSGTLTYQIDDEIDNGLLATGKVRNGKKHGPWIYERSGEGSIHVEYDMGTRVSEDRLAD